MHLENAILDLALILISACVVTVLFKKLKQPVVLGYIAVGILVGTNNDFFPTIRDEANIRLWGEIGIIFLLFALGLEFSFKKLFDVGRSAVVTALCVLLGMMTLGFSVGQMLEWSYIDSLFLGTMLSMSSTTIIIKAFDDMNLKKHRFTQIVFGILVVEDLFAILMMVLLSSVVVQSSFSGAELGESALKLTFMLAGWFIGGILIVPWLLKKLKPYLNSETLLILSIGLCLGMVVSASAAGFSSALGAFIMGSILAETNELPRIERLISPVKDLFGAVFFVSVGMLVSMDVIVEYWVPIAAIILVVVVGQITFSMVGLLWSGQTLHTAVRASFSLAQIGEFAFIIASLGNNLNVTSDFLYPIAVAVSVITTFTTPFIISLAPPAAQFLENRLPQRVLLFLNELRKDEGPSKVTHSHINTYLKQNIRYGLFSIVMLCGVVWATNSYIHPTATLHLPPIWADLTALLIGFILMIPFLWRLVFRPFYSESFKELWNNAHYRSSVILSISLINILAATLLLSGLFVSIYSYAKGLIGFLIISCTILLLFYKRIMKRVLQLERVFIKNMDSKRRNIENWNIKDLDIHLTQMTVSPNSDLLGKYLYKAELRNKYGVSIVSITRGSQFIYIPDRKEQLFPFDQIVVVGKEANLMLFSSLIEIPYHMEPSTGIKCKLRQTTIHPTSPLVSKSLSEAAIRERYSCLVVAIQREDGSEVMMNHSTVLLANDHLWITGPNDQLKLLVAESTASDSYTELPFEEETASTNNA